MFRAVAKGPRRLSGLLINDFVAHPCSIKAQSCQRVPCANYICNTSLQSAE
jgi:hypothetical protein